MRLTCLLGCVWSLLVPNVDQKRSFSRRRVASVLQGPGPGGWGGPGPKRIHKQIQKHPKTHFCKENCVWGCVLDSALGCACRGQGIGWGGPRPKPGRGQDGSKNSLKAHSKRTSKASQTDPNKHETYPKRTCKHTCMRHGRPNSFPHAFKTHIWVLHNISVLTQPDVHSTRLLRF